MSAQYVGYQGVEGSYSSVAVAEYFPGADRVGYPTFSEVVEALQRDEITHALLPIENSTAGRVADIHHLLPHSGLSIIGEHFLPVHHALIGVAGATRDDITHVYSHREALAQCGYSLRDRGYTGVPYGDTAGAVAYISDTQNSAYAALASTHAATLYKNVAVLEEHLEDSEDNVTRFLVLAREPHVLPSDTDVITSIVYDVPDTPAALHSSLSAFAKAQINIIKLESFVPMTRHKEAHFYLECVGNPSVEPFKSVMDMLPEYTQNLTVLGTYAQSPYRDHFKA